MLRQIIKTIRLIGLKQAVRAKKHHEIGLGYMRGYSVCQCWWTLLQCGFWDELIAKGAIDLDTYLEQHDFDRAVFESMIEYLHGVGLLERGGGQVRLTDEGQVLLDEPRGLLELGLAYEPCYTNLYDSLLGKKRYGVDFTRDVTYVGIGSGRLCEQLPYPVMRKMVLDHNCRMVLDLGCGDMAMLSGLCKQDNNIRCHGIDFSPEMIVFNKKQLVKDDFNGRLTTQQADMFDLPAMPEGLPPVDCIAACDTFHEYMGSAESEQRLIDLFQHLKQRFPGAFFVIGEFCLQDPAWLAKYKTASLEHHLFHELSGQQIGTAKQWRELFGRAGLQIVEENVFDLIGHGYFVLR